MLHNYQGPGHGVQSDRITATSKNLLKDLFSQHQDSWGQEGTMHMPKQKMQPLLWKSVTCEFLASPFRVCNEKINNCKITACRAYYSIFLRINKGCIYVTWSDKKGLIAHPILSIILNLVTFSVEIIPIEFMEIWDWKVRLS